MKANMIKRILEIGIAVKHAGPAAQRLVDILDAKRGPILTAKEYGMKAHMLRVGNVEFELMEPFGNSGLIHHFIQQRGEGLHHIAFQVKDISSAIEYMKKRGVQVINEEPVSIEGIKATFLHPASLEGVLIELIQGEPQPIDGRSLPTGLQTADTARGLGVEGLLGIMILVRDAKKTAEAYAALFDCDTPVRRAYHRSGFDVWVCRAGNVDLIFLDRYRKHTRLSQTESKEGVGLYQIVLKVKNLKQAVKCLKKNGVNFVRRPESQLGSFDPLLTTIDVLGGTPMLLIEKIPVDNEVWH